jgi:transmembrane sensor
MRKVDLKTLARYFSAECTEKEKENVEEWLNSDVKNRRLFDELKSIWEISGSAVVDKDLTYPLQRLSAIVRENESDSNGENSPRLCRIELGHSRTPRVLNMVFRVAAVFLLFVGTFYSAYYLKQKALMRESESYNGNFVIEEASTKPGQRVSFRFADGTKVTLNSASHLKYSSDPKGARNVYLDGEAYFEVVHSEEHPFFVHVRDEVIRDVGTKFDVKGWSDDGNTQVTVVEGVVAIQPNAKIRHDVIVSRDQYCIVDNDGLLLPPTNTDVSSELDWLTGRLVFRNTPMNEVIKQIRRRYGIYCFVSDSSILSKTITTSFGSREPVNRVLNVIALSLDLTCKISNDSALFIPSAHILKAERALQMKEYFER